MPPGKCIIRAFADGEQELFLVDFDKVEERILELLELGYQIHI